MKRSVSPKKLAGNFVRVPHAAIDDIQDLVALGLLAYLERIPPGQTFTRTKAVERYKQGRTSIDAAMEQLVAKGYVKYVISTDKTGAKTTTIYHSITPASFDREAAAKAVHPSNSTPPTAGFPTAGKQHQQGRNVVDFRQPVKRHLNNQEELNKKEEGAAELPAGRLPCPRCNGQSPTNCERCEGKGTVAAHG